MGDKLPTVSGKNMIKLLEKEGFVLKRIRGSHHLMRKELLCTVVPVHGNRDLKPGTLRGILGDIDMSPKEFRSRLQK